MSRAHSVSRLLHTGLDVRLFCSFWTKKLFMWKVDRPFSFSGKCKVIFIVTAQHTCGGSCLNTLQWEEYGPKINLWDNQTDDWLETKYISYQATMEKKKKKYFLSVTISIFGSPNFGPTCLVSSPFLNSAGRQIMHDAARRLEGFQTFHHSRNHHENLQVNF